MYLARLEKLAELSVLSPYYTEVAFHSLVLVDGGGATGYPPSGINFRNGGGKPYVPPGQSPQKLREDLTNAAQPFVELQLLRNDIREPISRALRWLYRGKDYRISADDQLIYRWIAFNSLYTLFNSLEGIERSERMSIREFEERFRSSVGIVKEGTQDLASSGLQLDRGRDKDVSVNLQQSIDANDMLVTQHALECVYAARCSLFHGSERPVLHVSNVTMVIAARYLDSYLRKAFAPFISFCTNNS